MLDPVGDPAPAQPVCPHHQVLPDAQPREDAASLRHIGDAQRDDAVRRNGTQRDALELQGFGGGFHEPEDRLQGRALAGAIGADDAQARPLGNGEAHSAHGHHTAVSDVQVAHHEPPGADRRHTAACRSLSWPR